MPHNDSDYKPYPELAPIFKSYEALRDAADAIFSRVEQTYPHCVKCAPGCSDCCHALFDLPLVEAMYINRAFKDAFPHGRERSDILEKAADADRRLAKTKRDMFRAERAGTSTEELMNETASLRMRCPLLNAKNECSLYDKRPITCRLYGAPLDIGGKGHVCGFSGFNPGEPYPTARLEKIQSRLDQLGGEIEKILKSRFRLTDIYMPLSMALLTDYDDKFLGVGEEQPEK